MYDVFVYHNIWMPVVGLTTVVRQNFGESRVLKLLSVDRSIS